MYNQAVDFWQLLVKVLEKMQEMGVLGAKSRFLWAQLWGAHMRFFRQMLMAAKVRVWPTQGRGLRASGKK